MSASELVGESNKTKPPAALGGEMAMSKEQQKKLRTFVKRGTDIEEKASQLKGLKSALMDEVEDAGLDRKVVKAVIREISTPKEDREFFQEKFDFYMGVIESGD